MTLLEARSLTIHFGRLTAVRDVSLRIESGEIHAIIGPNGAGKTTLLNLLSGELHPTAGSLHFRGEDVTRWTPNRRAKAGIGRSFQHSSVFDDLSVHENIRLATQLQFPRCFGLFRAASRYGDVNSRVADILADLSLADFAEMRAGELSHGGQRQLEIAMLMAISPTLMLLDEPTSGMSRNESLDLIGTLRQLAQRHTLVLVEHDMDVVFELANRITVLVDGSVIASGMPAAIRAHTAVRSAYLGQDH